MKRYLLLAGGSVTTELGTSLPGDSVTVNFGPIITTYIDSITSICF